MKKKPIIKIREIDDEELKEILKNDDIIHVREDNIDEVIEKLEEVFG